MGECPKRVSCDADALASIMTRAGDAARPFIYFGRTCVYGDVASCLLRFVYVLSSSPLLPPGLPFLRFSGTLSLRQRLPSFLVARRASQPSARTTSAPAVYELPVRGRKLSGEGTYTAWSCSANAPVLPRFVFLSRWASRARCRFRGRFTFAPRVGR